MAVIINEIEVVLEPPEPPAGEAPPEPTPRDEPMATETVLSPGDVRSVLDYLEHRETRVRAC